MWVLSLGDFGLRELVTGQDVLFAILSEYCHCGPVCDFIWPPSQDCLSRSALSLGLGPSRPGSVGYLGLSAATLLYTAGHLEIWQIDDLRGVPILAPATLAGWAPVREPT